MNASIFLYGSSGVGKSSVAKVLADRLACKYVSGDSLRQQAKESSEPKNSLFSYGTAKAYRHFGPLTNENSIQGLILLRQIMEPLVENCLISLNENVVFETPFLNPLQANRWGSVVLLTLDDERQHQANVYAVRTNTSRKESIFRSSRMQQDFLKQEALRNNIAVVSNSLQSESVVDAILQKCFTHNS